MLAWTTLWRKVIGIEPRLDKKILVSEEGCQAGCIAPSTTLLISLDVSTK
jgi:hypothetical protein